MNDGRKDSLYQNRFMDIGCSIRNNNTVLKVIDEIHKTFLSSEKIEDSTAMSYNKGEEKLG